MKTSGTDGDAMDTRSSQASASFQSGDLVQVELLTESTFADEQGEQDEVIPQGTQLVGVWETKQSASMEQPGHSTERTWCSPGWTRRA